MSKVTPLRDSPALTDIPGSLRQLANAYDDEPEDMPRSFLWVEYNDDGSIDLGCFGECPTNKAQVVGILALAQRRFNHEIGDLHRGDRAVGELAPVIHLKGKAMKMKEPVDENEGGVRPSVPYTPEPEKATSRSWIGWAAGALIVAVLVYLFAR